MNSDQALWSALIERVGGFFKIPIAALIAGNMSGCAAHARAIACYVAHCELGLSEHQVGAMSGLHQTSVCRACQVIEERREDPALDAAIEVLGREFRRRFPAPPPVAANDNLEACAPH